MKRLLTAILAVLAFAPAAWGLLTVKDPTNPGTITKYEVIGPDADGGYLFQRVSPSLFRDAPASTESLPDGDWYIGPLQAHSIAAAEFSNERAIRSLDIRDKIVARVNSLRAEDKSWRDAKKRAQLADVVPVWNMKGVYQYAFRESLPDGSTLVTYSPRYFRDAAGTERLVLRYKEMGRSAVITPVPED